MASVRANQVAQQSSVRGEHERTSPSRKILAAELRRYSLNFSIDQLL
jgi:hypothetical protein